MPEFRISNLGEYGIIRDLKPYRLPPNAFSSGDNVRFFEQVVAPVQGYTDLAPLSTVTLDSMYWVQHFYSGSNDWWVFPGLASATEKVAMVTLEGTERNITPTGGETFAISNGDQWSGGPFMGNCIISNGRSSEVFYIDSPDSGSPLMQELEYTTGTDLYTQIRCEVVRPWKNYLIGLGVQVVPGGGLAGVSQGFYPNLMWWSDVAGPGQVPGSWDAADASTHAGYQPFGELRAEFVDAVPLGDRLMIYAANTIHSAHYVGPQAGVFQFHKDLFSAGAMATNCVAPVEMQGQPVHFVLGSGDFYMLDGVVVRSVLDDRWRRILFESLEPDHYRNSFVVANQLEDEVWCCYPSDGNTYPNNALVYNYRANTIYHRSLPTGTTFGTWGRQTTGEATFGTINSVSTIINQVSQIINSRDDYQPANQTLVTVDTSANAFRHNQGNQFNATDPTCRATREGIGFDADYSAQKCVLEMWPEVTSDTAESIEIRIGAQDRVDDATSWGSWKTFTPGTDSFIPVESTGRLHSYDVRSTNGSNWRMTGMRFVWEPVGMY